MPAPSLFPRRGAVAAPLTMEVGRELTLEDIQLLATSNAKVGVPILQRYRAIHHRQAVLLAEGKPVNVVAAVVGCTPARVVQLQNDPTFRDLVDYYRDQIIAASLADAARLRDKIVDLGEMAVDELRDRMEDDAKRKSMGVNEVRKIAEFAMDRTVAPPQAAPPPNLAPATVTINFGTGLRPGADPSAEVTIDATITPATEE